MDKGKGTYEKTKAVVDGYVNDAFFVVASTCIDQSDTTAVLCLPSEGIATAMDPHDPVF